MQLINSKMAISIFIKFTIRIIISIVIGIPTIWILYLSFTCMGLFFIVPIIGMFGIPFCWLIGDKTGLEESKEMFKSGWELLIQPFLFWYLFIIGKNPFIEFGM